MKNFKIFALAIAMVGMASCAENAIENPDNNPADGTTGYLAVKVDLEKQTRGSDEQTASPDESALKSVYLVTFNGDDVVANPDGGYYIKLDATQLTAANNSGVVIAKVSAAADQIMAVANPGTELLGALNSLTSGSTYDQLNAAIEGITIAEVVDATDGFTMISCPADDALAVGGTIADALLGIDPISVDGTTYTTDQEAMDAAAEDPIEMAIERLSSKIVFKPVPAVGAGLEVLPAGAKFAFTSWTVDAVNTTLFPFAEKTIIGAAHTLGDYKYNFYTEDPNYDYIDAASYHDGLAYATIDATTKAPILPWTVGGVATYPWEVADKSAYLVENTMAAMAQQYGNATRIVIKGTYTPAGFTEGADWFSFAGENYQTLADLQAAAADANASDELVDAGDAFAVQMGGTTLAAMTQADLTAKNPNGGEWAKVPPTGVGIRYYQDAVNYWFYEIRHNGEANTTMEYSKYGVVRNNWYNCTLNKVSGAGTPWYPDLVNPGDGDPKPEDPIDEEYGYVGIEITPQPWIIWENGMTI